MDKFKKKGGEIRPFAGVSQTQTKDNTDITLTASRVGRLHPVQRNAHLTVKQLQSTIQKISYNYIL